MTDIRTKTNTSQTALSVMEPSSPSALQTAVKSEDGNTGITQEVSEKLSLADYFAGVLNLGFLKEGSKKISTGDALTKYILPIVGGLVCFYLAYKLLKKPSKKGRRA